MIRPLRIISLVFSLIASVPPLCGQTPQVPTRMEFCGMKITMTPALQKKVQTQVDKLYASKEYFQRLCERVGTYMPFIEEAFAMVGVPDDLKYIAILESALIGDAVSPANAVGFWQFKEAAAKEAGLRVDAQVDDRKHIFHASAGAARYFWRLNRDYDNWIYATIGYNQGPTGGLAFMDAKFFGVHEMELDENLHFYAMKSLAHKVAFEPVLKKNEKPRAWLEPHLTEGAITLTSLAAQHAADTARVRMNNLWALGGNVPGDARFAWFIPRYDIPPPQDLKRSIRDFFSAEEVHAVHRPPGEDKPAPRTHPAASAHGGATDPEYGFEYAIFGKDQHLIEYAVRTGKSLKSLQHWNRIPAGEEPHEGSLIYLVSPASARYHIVIPGEKIADIARRHGTDPAKLLKRNRITERELKAGMKLSLKRRIAKGKKPPVVISFAGATVTSATRNVAVSAEGNASASLPISWKPVRRLPALTTEWIEYVVQPGDALWKIAKNYNSASELIRKINGLPDTKIIPGQKLKVMVRKETQ